MTVIAETLPDPQPENPLALLQAVFGYQQFQAGPARDHRADSGGARCPGAQTHRRRQVALLPDPGAAAAGLGVVVSPHLADEGSGRHPARQRRGGGLHQLGSEPGGDDPELCRHAPGEIKLVYVSPSVCCSTSSWTGWRSCPRPVRHRRGRTAFPSGDTIFRPEYAALGRLKQWFPRCPWWRSPPPPTRRPAATCCTGWN